MATVLRPTFAELWLMNSVVITMPKVKSKKKPTKKPTRKKAARKPVKKPAPGYAKHRERMATRAADQSKSEREIGEIPPIADIRRRAACIRSLKLFAETYNPEALYHGWSKGLLRAIDRIEEAVFQGALYALAFERGGGKTVLCRTAAWWAISNALARYVSIVGATGEKGCEAVETIKTLMRFKDTYAGDFPEISWAVRHLRGIPNRANGQTCGGESTLIKWATDYVVLPTVPPPSNWPPDWSLRADGKVPTSGCLISGAGLTAEGLRGSLKTLSTGEMVRPDFVLLDDPQTAVSAGSIAQNTSRLKLIMGDVLGMAGPGKALSAVMPCTVIEQGDMVDVILDRKKNPLWRGERSGILSEIPKNKAAWEAYFEIYARCAQFEPPDHTESNAYYRLRQAELEEGVEASWANRKFPEDVSAIQHAMHIYFRDPVGFMSEYMNMPQNAIAEASLVLSADMLEAKVTNLAAGSVPRSATRLTAMIDVGGDLLWWAVSAFDERFGGGPIAFGVYPEQSRQHFAKSDPRPGLCGLSSMSGQSQDAALWSALTAVVDAIVGKSFIQEETRAELRVERCLVDANWGEKTDLVYDFCRRSPYAAILLPSHGKGIGASSNPISNWKISPGEKPGRGWRVTPTGKGRHITFDTNMWKSFVADRLLSPPGSAGCWHLPEPAHQSRLFAEHLASEYAIENEVKSYGRKVAEWKRRANRDNDWFDCLVGSAVAASVQGLVWAASGSVEPKRQARYVDPAKLYDAAKNLPIL